MADKSRVSREKLLERMGIGEEDFDNYVDKISSFFFGELNDDQKRFYLKTNGRTEESTAKSLGPDVSIADVQALYAKVPRIGEICMISCCGIRNPPPPPPHNAVNPT